jgi:hypothetical protein
MLDAMLGSLTLPPGLELIFSYLTRVETTPRNVEAGWNLLWDSKLQEEVARIQTPNFTYTGQFPLVQRKSMPSVVAGSTPESAKKEKGDDDNEEDEEEEEESDTEDESSDEEGPANDSPVKGVRSKMDADDRAFPGRKPPQNLTPGMSLRGQSSSSAGQPVTPPPTQRHANRPPPGTDKSIPAKRGVDFFFLVDYAFVHIQLDLSAKRPLKTLMGFKNVQAAIGNVPVLIELKSGMPRTKWAKQPDEFELGLNKKITKGFKDINRKFKAAFACFPSQKSVVGISACGPWWAFTLLTLNTSIFKTTQAFVLCGGSHNKLLSIILDAAANSPSDPLAYNNGILVHYFKRLQYRRATVAGQGRLAPMDIDLSL